MTWRAAPSCKAVLDQANALWPTRSKASDGTIGDADHSSRTSDHNPTDEGWVNAVDITHDPANGCDAHRWAREVAARRDPRVKYLISNTMMCSSYAARGYAAWEWRPYTGVNGHFKHAHLSVHDTPTARNDTSPWFVGAHFSPPAPQFPSIDAGDIDMAQAKFMLVGPLDDQGCGHMGWDTGRPVNWCLASRQGPFPPTDGYWYENARGPANEVRTKSSPIPSVQPRGNTVVVSIEGGQPKGWCGVWLLAG